MPVSGNTQIPLSPLLISCLNALFFHPSPFLLLERSVRRVPLFFLTLDLFFEEEDGPGLHVAKERLVFFVFLKATFK